MSCQQVPTTPALNPYPRSVQVGEFEVAIDGGIWVAIRADVRVTCVYVEEVAEELILPVPFDLNAIRLVPQSDRLSLALPHEAHCKVLIGLQQPGVANTGGENDEWRASRTILGDHCFGLSSQFRGDDQLAFVAYRADLCDRLGVLIAFDDVMPVVVAGLLGDAIE